MKAILIVKSKLKLGLKKGTVGRISKEIKRIILVVILSVEKWGTLLSSKPVENRIQIGDREIIMRPSFSHINRSVK